MQQTVGSYKLLTLYVIRSVNNDYPFNDINQLESHQIRSRLLEFVYDTGHIQSCISHMSTMC